jgi:hypothetical protein
MYLGLPVMSWRDVNKLYGDTDIFVTANELSAPNIIGILLEQGISIDRILNYEPVEKRLGCRFAETLLDVATFGGLELYCCFQSETGTKTFCSELPRIKVDYNKFGDDAMNQFFQLRNLIADRIKNGNIPHECEQCKVISEEYYYSNRKIRAITLGGDGPCNYQCLDCGHQYNAKYQHKSPFNEIKQAFSTIRHTTDCDSDVRIVLSVGEFSMSDEGNDLVRYLHDYHVTLYSNAYKWSDAVAEALGDGRAYLYVSVDAGTPETYAKIKGIKDIGAFDVVCNNLREYSKYGIIILKYIVFEGGGNDNHKDFNGFFGLADEIASRVVIYCTQSISWE